MTTEVRIPRLGVTMEEGVLSEWLVADGGDVEVGESLYVLETDKVETQIEAPVGGRLRVIGVPGETYQVGDLVGEIE